MTTVWPSRRLRFGRSRRNRRGSDDGRERPRRPFAGGAGSRRRAPGFECHGSRPAFRGQRNMETGRHHAKGRRTDPPQGEWCRPFPAPVPGVEPGATLGIAEGSVAYPCMGRGAPGDRTRRCSVIHHWASSDACSAPAVTAFLRRRATAMATPAAASAAAAAAMP